jgi:hypothetical protein
MTQIFVAATSGGPVTTAVTEQRWINRTNKTTPVLADSLCLLDSANSGNEVITTWTQSIASLSLLTFTGTPIASNLIVWGSSTTATDSGITVDHSQNITNVNQITITTNPTLNMQVATKVYADSKFSISNNLSEGNAASMRTSLALGTAATKNSTTSGANVASTSGTFTAGHYLIAADSSGTVADGGPATPVAFVDNALFSSNGGSSALSETPVALNTGNLSQISPGSLWATNGDNVGMKCGTKGGYSLIAQIPLLADATAGGISYFYVAVNGTQFGQVFPAGNTGATLTNLNVTTVNVYGLLSLNVGDVVTIVGVTTGLNPQSVYYDPTYSNGLSVLIERKT